MSNILFICTSNFYRSRFAETLFNHYVEEHNRSLVAFSRGLEVFKQLNQGPLSPHARDYLEKLGIDLLEPLPYPQQLSQRDLSIAEQVILMDREEHYPMMQQYFPDFAEKSEYWSFGNPDRQSPEQMLPQLDQKIREIIEQY